MSLGANVTPPVIHPPTNLVNHKISTTVVPHIYPIHTTTINHHLLQHKYYNPQTSPCYEDMSHQQINCCNPYAPGGIPGGIGIGPGPMGGPMMGPGPMGGPMMGPGPMGGPMMGSGFY